MIKKTVHEMQRPDAETFRRQSKLALSLVLDNVRSLNNIGSMFRTADGFALREICLCGISATPPSVEIHKTALGAEDSVTWRYFGSTVEALRTLASEGNSILALELTHSSIPLQEFRPRDGQGYALVVGNEVDGVDEDVLALCDACLEIPQRGTKHSLNVAVSASIAMWHFFEHMNLKNSTSR